jgi:hypothetical protein
MKSINTVLDEILDGMVKRGVFSAKSTQMVVGEPITQECPCGAHVIIDPLTGEGKCQFCGSPVFLEASDDTEDDEPIQELVEVGEHSSCCDCDRCTEDGEPILTGGVVSKTNQLGFEESHVNTTPENLKYY